MAATWNHHRYLTTTTDHLNPTATINDPFEFEESELWSTNTNNTVTISPKSGPKNHRPVRKPVRSTDRAPIGPRSLPVNIPDWSKILRTEYRRNSNGEFFDGEDDDDVEVVGDEMTVLPPHEYLARTRVASLSVHEGVGRTLKGRDLSRVRNAIWKQTGFELD